MEIENLERGKFVNLEKNCKFEKKIRILENIWNFGEKIRNLENLAIWKNLEIWKTLDILKKIGKIWKSKIDLEIWKKGGNQ